MDAKNFADVVGLKNVSFDELETNKLLVAGGDNNNHTVNALPILFESLTASPKLHALNESVYLNVVRDYVDELIDNCCELIANDNNNNQDDQEDSSLHDCQLSSDVDTSPTVSNHLLLFCFQFKNAFLYLLFISFPCY